MILYPYHAPIILTDDLYVQYGGQTGTTTDAQRQAAYRIAEIQATSYIGTFLLPTIVTGQHLYNFSPFIATDYGYVWRILAVTMRSKKNLTGCDIQEDSGCAFIMEDTFGYLNVHCVVSTCQCSPISPYQFQIAYEAGLPSGTSFQPPILHALTIAAELNLNEMSYPRMNEGAGDVGIQKFKNMDYYEDRVDFKQTAFGSSARAAYAARLIDSVIKKARRALVL